jgi:hypothetical protein
MTYYYNVELWLAPLVLLLPLVLDWERRGCRDPEDKKDLEEYALLGYTPSISSLSLIC